MLQMSQSLRKTVVEKKTYVYTPAMPHNIKLLHLSNPCHHGKRDVKNNDVDNDTQDQKLRGGNSQLYFDGTFFFQPSKNNRQSESAESELGI